MRALSQALQLAQGFKLIFARCNQPDQRQKLIAALRAELPGLKVQEIHFNEPVPHLLDALRERIKSPTPDALFVSGLEYSLPTAAEAHATPFVANLNASRNSFPQVIPCPLVLWLPEYILNAIMLGAPDFFSIRSGSYFFAATAGDTADVASSLVREHEWVAASLSLAEKESRIAAIQSLLSDYEALVSDQRDPPTEMRLHVRLGDLFHAIGSYSSARQHYEQALTIARDLKIRDWECVAAAYVGNIARHQGLWAEAEKFYKTSLMISRDLDDKSREGMALGSLANLYRAQGRLDEAEKYYQQVLTTFREDDDEFNESVALSNLGNTYTALGRYDEAENHLQQSLTIDRKLGNRDGEGTTLNNLGRIYRRRKRWSEAETYYQSSLTICREIGAKFNEGATLNNLGLMYVEQGRLEEANQVYQQSLAIHREIRDCVGEATTLISLARLYSAQGDLAKAVTAIRQAVEILKETEDGQKLITTQKLLEDLEREDKEQGKPETTEQ
ncbi:MAG TPA: tetratricopeptide repeat protein [Pyrinomonadaceae bacterium]|nr:tetratricopeptide repeat protein [Pyrinomonadaceae bacterium]